MTITDITDRIFIEGKIGLELESEGLLDRTTVICTDTESEPPTESTAVSVMK